jgi:hypothetical protein
MECVGLDPSVLQSMKSLCLAAKQKISNKSFNFSTTRRGDTPALFGFSSSSYQPASSIAEQNKGWNQHEACVQGNALLEPR